MQRLRSWRWNKRRSAPYNHHTLWTSYSCYLPYLTQYLPAYDYDHGGELKWTDVRRVSITLYSIHKYMRKWSSCAHYMSLFYSPNVDDRWPDSATCYRTRILYLLTGLGQVELLYITCLIDVFSLAAWCHLLLMDPLKIYVPSVLFWVIPTDLRVGLNIALLVLGRTGAP